jgi:hypothetical protein
MPLQINLSVMNCNKNILLLVLMLLFFSCSSQKYFIIRNESPGQVMVSYSLRDSDGFFSYKPVIISENRSGSKKAVLEKEQITDKNIKLSSRQSLIIGGLKKGEARKLENSINEMFNLQKIKIASEAGSVEKEGSDAIRLFYRDDDGNFSVIITN